MTKIFRSIPVSALTQCSSSLCQSSAVSWWTDSFSLGWFFFFVGKAELTLNFKLLFKRNRWSYRTDCRISEQKVLQASALECQT